MTGRNADRVSRPRKCNVYGHGKGLLANYALFMVHCEYFDLSLERFWEYFFNKSRGTVNVLIAIIADDKLNLYLEQIRSSFQKCVS